MDDRGLHYADGAFETLACTQGRIHCAALHEDRLARAMAALRFAGPARQAAKVFSDAQRCLDHVKHTGTARLTVTRGSGPRGYAPTDAAQARSILSAYPPYVPASESLRCGVAETHWANQPQLAGLKLLARTEQVLAAQEASTQGWDDALMLDEKRQVISSSKGNLFLVTGTDATTPCLNRCGIAGTRRQILINVLLPQMGYSVSSRPVLLRECLEADALIVTNTVMGVTAINSIAEAAFSDSRGVELARRLQSALSDHIAACDAK